MRLIILFQIICVSAGFASGPCESTHPFSVNDLLAMERISDPQVSPDGEWIVFVLQKSDLEADRGRSDLWMVRSDGTGLRRLTSHAENDSNPRFSADGKSIYFLSKRSDSSQVWRIRIDGGEAQQITELPLDAANLLVSSDGLNIAFTMEVFPDCNTPECTKKRLDEIEQKKTSGRIYERIFIRPTRLPNPSAGRKR